MLPPLKNQGHKLVSTKETNDTTGNDLIPFLKPLSNELSYSILGLRAT